MNASIGLRTQEVLRTFGGSGRRTGWKAQYSRSFALKDFVAGADSAAVQVDARHKIARSAPDRMEHTGRIGQNTLYVNELPTV